MEGDADSEPKAEATHRGTSHVQAFPLGSTEDQATQFR